MTIAKYGTPEQQAKYGRGCRMDRSSVVVLTEPGAGSDAFGSMHPRSCEGDEYVLNGSKTFITNAPYADVFVVYAKLSDNGSGKDIQPFLVGVAHRASTPRSPSEDGTHSSPTGAVYLDDVRIPKQNLLGGGVRERDHVKSRLGDERAGMPTLSLGLADRAFELALRYAMERQQFGNRSSSSSSCSAASPHVRAARQHAELRLRDFPPARSARTTADVCAGKLYCCEAASRSPTTRSTSSRHGSWRSTRSSGWRATRSSWSSARHHEDPGADDRARSHPTGDRLMLPLQSTRMLDLSRQMPGPFCSALLADMGWTCWWSPIRPTRSAPAYRSSCAQAQHDAEPEERRDGRSSSARGRVRRVARGGRARSDEAPRRRLRDAGAK